MIKANVYIDHYKWQKKLKDPKKYVNKKIKKASKILGSKNKEFSILLTSNLKMKKLNNKFRKINKPTDVLSFPIKEKGINFLKLSSKVREFVIQCRLKIKYPNPYIQPIENIANLLFLQFLRNNKYNNGKVKKLRNTKLYGGRLNELIEPKTNGIM